jgi:hypothetical protein
MSDRLTLANAIAVPPPASLPATPLHRSTRHGRALRRQVEAAMAERGASYADVAQAIGRSAVAVRIDISSRRPPRPTVQAKLRAWLAAAPAVAANGRRFDPIAPAESTPTPASATALPTDQRTCVWEEKTNGWSRLQILR